MLIKAISNNVFINISNKIIKLESNIVINFCEKNEEFNKLSTLIY